MLIPHSPIKAEPPQHATNAKPALVAVLCHSHKTPLSPKITPNEYNLNQNEQKN